MILLTGYIDVPADRLAEVRIALPEHIRLSCEEPGNLMFKVIEDIDVPGRLNVKEVFTDRASFEAHQARTQASDWAKVTEGLPRTYEIQEMPDTERDTP